MKVFGFDKIDLSSCDKDVIANTKWKFPCYCKPSANGVFNHSDQLSNFSEDWEMRDKTKFHEHFCYSHSRIAIISTIFSGKHVTFFEMGLEKLLWGNEYKNIADFGLQKWKMTQNLLETLL